MIRLRGFAYELRRAREGVGALGLTAVLVAGSAVAEEQPTAAPPAQAAPHGGKSPAMKPMGGPTGAPGHGGKDRADSKDSAGGDDKGHGPKGDGHEKDAKDAHRGSLGPDERAALALERSKERLAQAAVQAQQEEGEPDPKTRAQRRAARRAFLRAQHDLRKASGKKFELTVEQKTSLKEKLDKQAAAEEGTRAKRMTAEQAKVKLGYGKALGHAPIRRELRRFAWRIARLERAKDIAEAADQKALLERANGLVTAENARHDKRMKQLMDSWKKAGSPKGVLPSEALKAAAKSGEAPTAAAPGAVPKTAVPVAPAPLAKPATPAAPPHPAPAAAPEAK